MNVFQRKEYLKDQSTDLIVLFFFNILLISFLNAGLVYLFYGVLIAKYVFFVSFTLFLLGYFFQSQVYNDPLYVSESLRATLVDSNSVDLAKRKLINVVEEISIASMTPKPLIYMLNEDKTINALAAGTDVRNSMICVTSGAVELLTKEELLAVVAHEYSHIINFDMDLNSRLSRVVRCFNFIYKSGKSAFYDKSRYDSILYRRSSYHFNFVGLGFMAIGSLGFFLGQVIQKQFCRKRELLADHNSAIFTRNPQALASALAKIKLYGSHLRSINSYDLAHFCIAEVKSSESTFSTHPSIDERILNLLPGLNSVDIFYEAVKKGANKSNVAHANLAAVDEDIKIWQKKHLIDQASVQKTLIQIIIYFSSQPERIINYLPYKQNEDELSRNVKLFVSKNYENIFHAVNGCFEFLVFNKSNLNDIWNDLYRLMISDGALSFNEAVVLSYIKFLMSKRIIRKMSLVGRKSLNLKSVTENILKLVVWILTDGEGTGSSSYKTKYLSRARFYIPASDSQINSLKVEKINWSDFEVCINQIGQLSQKDKMYVVGFMSDVFQISRNANDIKKTPLLSVMLKQVCLILGVPRSMSFELVL